MIKSWLSYQFKFLFLYVSSVFSVVIFFLFFKSPCFFVFSVVYTLFKNLVF
jgi:hypothetical protein